MKREIKFRGLRVIVGGFVYGDLIHGQGHKRGQLFILPQTHNYPPGCSDLDGWNVDPESVGQFTGVSDKYGKEIYEGDIITVEYGKGQVVFAAGCFMIQWIDDPEANMEWLGMYHKPHQLGQAREDIEVVGNIYEKQSK